MQTFPFRLFLQFSLDLMIRGRERVAYCFSRAGRLWQLLRPKIQVLTDDLSVVKALKRRGRLGYKGHSAGYFGGGKFLTAV